MLLSAAKINKAGYDVKLDQNEPTIVNARTGEKMKLKMRNGNFVIDMWIDTEIVGRVFNRQGR